MALFSKRAGRTSRRALRRAHTKTLKAQAQARAKFERSTAKKAEKAARKAAKKGRRTAVAAVAEAPALSRRAAGRASRKAERTEKKLAKKVPAKKSTSAQVKSGIAVARVLAPVLAPFAYRGAAQLRGQLDNARARRMGVSVDDLGRFSGHGATLSARIAGIEPVLAEMSATHVDAESVTYRETTQARLAELATAVHAAERMPVPRRKAAHRAVAVDLDRIDTELLRRLGVR